jgi:hypothetical protein
VFEGDKTISGDNWIRQKTKRIPSYITLATGVGSLKKPEYAVSFSASTKEGRMGQLAKLGGMRGYHYGTILQ